MDRQHAAAIEKQEDELYTALYEIKQTNLDFKSLLDSSDVCPGSKYRSRFHFLPNSRFPFETLDKELKELLKQFVSFNSPIELFHWNRRASLHRAISKGRVLSSIQFRNKILKNQVLDLHLHVYNLHLWPKEALISQTIKKHRRVS